MFWIPHKQQAIKCWFLVTFRQENLRDFINFVEKKKDVIWTVVIMDSIGSVKISITGFTQQKLENLNYTDLPFRYLKLVEKYPTAIAGQLFAHHHTDSFKVFSNTRISYSQ